MNNDFDPLVVDPGCCGEVQEEEVAIMTQSLQDLLQQHGFPTN
jgi:hypothetical protein